VAYPLFLAKLLIRTGIARLLPWVQRMTEGGEAFLPYYSDDLLCAPHAKLREMLAMRQGLRRDGIDLATAAPCFDLLPSGSTNLPSDQRDAPPIGGLPELRTAVADKLRRDNGLVVHPSGEVLITAGVAAAWHMVLDALVNAGDRIVLFDPSSPLYSFGLRRRRAKIRWVPTWMENGRVRFKATQLIDALRGARLLVVTSPANPCGGVFLPEDCELMAWWTHRRDVLLFHDTVFERFAYDADLVRIGSLSRAQDRTLTAGSLSKGHGLGSARIGWLAAHRHLLRPCVLSTAMEWSSVPTLCQLIALQALEQSEEVFAPLRADFAVRRAYTFERISAMGLKPDWPAGGHFLWVPIRELGLDGAEFAAQLARSRQVHVWPGNHFGPSGAGHIRISYAAEEGRLRQGLGRMSDFVRQLQAAGGPLLNRRAA
jgi:aspartate/methionine/tyrosine aminotransferase